MLRRHLAIAALLAMCSGLLIVGGAGPARGACSADGDMVKALTEAEVVFVGSVYSVSSHDRIAVMEVLEIWKGPILQATVGVHGGNASSSAVRPDDRTFEAGRTYLVVPTNGEPPFVDSLCTATQLYRPTGEIPTEYKYAVGASDVRYTEAVAAVAAQPSALTELGGYVNDPTVWWAVGALVVAGVGFVVYRGGAERREKKREATEPRIKRRLSFEGMFSRSGERRLRKLRSRAK